MSKSKAEGYITVKCIYMPHYEVELMQDPDGAYLVRYRVHDEDHYSERITDYGTASYIFDLKHQDLQGN